MASTLLQPFTLKGGGRIFARRPLAEPAEADFHSKKTNQAAIFQLAELKSVKYNL